MNWKFTLQSTTYGNALIDQPIGWSDISINIARDLKVHGLTFEYAVGLKFIGTGYYYIKNAYNSGGIDQYIELRIQVQCSENDAFEEFYLGKLFLGKLVFDCIDDMCYVEAVIEPSGCQMTFKNRIDQKIDLAACQDIDKNPLPCYNKLPFSLNIEPKTIIRQTTGVVNPFTNEYEECQSVTTGTGCEHHETTRFVEPYLDTYSLNEILVSNALQGTFSSLPANVTEWIVASINGTYKIDINLYLRFYIRTDAICPDPSSPPTDALCGCTGISSGFNDTRIVFCLEKNNVLFHTQILNSNIGSCLDDLIENYCVNYSNTISLNKNDTVKVYFEMYVAGDYKRKLADAYPVGFHFIYEQRAGNTCGPQVFSIKSTTASPTTPSKAYMINEAMSRAVEGITNDCMRVKSDYFGRTDSQPYTSPQDGCGSLEIITNGLHLRQFPDAKVRFAQSFQELFDNSNSIHNIGYGIEPDPNRTGFDLVRVEPMRYFYDNTVLMTCDFIPDLKRRIMAEWYVSIFGFGFEKWEAEQTSGLDEFNVKRQYRSTLKEVKRNLNVVSRFIASGYSIEVTRTEAYLDDSTKDFRWDNETFIICVRREAVPSGFGVEQGKDCINTSAAINLVDPDSIYNIRISPNRNFLRWLPYLLSNYFPNIFSPNAEFKLDTSEGNFKAETNLINGCIPEFTGSPLSEGEDLGIYDTFLQGAIIDYKPVYRFELVEFDYPLSFSQYKLIKLNPRGTIRYRCRDMANFEDGYIYSISYKPNEGIATFTLLPKFIP